MKKLYIFLALVLTFLGIGVTRALRAFVDDFRDADELTNGMLIMIGQNITDQNGTLNKETGEYTHTLANKYKVLWDANEQEMVAAQGNVMKDAIKLSYLWELEAAEGDGWFYLKNKETGRYIGCTVNELREPMDPANPVTLHNLNDGRDDEQWWRENVAPKGEERQFVARCNIPLTLVENVADAKAFTFKSIEDGIDLMDGTLGEAAADLVSYLEQQGDIRMMIMTQVEVKGKKYWTAMNSAYNGHLTNYYDWAAYWEVDECYVEDDDPQAEFEEFMSSPTLVTHFPIGTDPGCVVETEAAERYNERIVELKEMVDKDFSDDKWAELLAEAKALVAEAETFTFRPMVAGYYRFVCSWSRFEEVQGVEKAMYAEGTNAKWGTLDEGEEMYDVDEETGEETYIGLSGLDQIWEVTLGEDGHFYVKNMKTQLYFKNAAQSKQVEMSGTPKWVEFISLGRGDFNLKVENTGFALHTAGHSSDNNSAADNEKGNIVGWNNTSPSGSTWYVRTVTAEEIAEKWEINSEAALQADLQDLINKAQTVLDAAKNSAHATYDKGTEKLLTDASQLATNYQESTEGPIENAIDGDNSTYWHSDWHTTNTTPHYLQVELPAAYQDLVFYYVNRNGDDYAGSPTSFRFDYCATADGEYTEGPTVDGAQHSRDAIEQEFLVTLPEAAKYIRIFAPVRYAAGGKQYWHCAEIQFYEAANMSVSPDLFEKTGEIGTALEEAIAAAGEVETATKDDIAALQAALDAFLAVYTDPAELNAKIAEAVEQTKQIAGGTLPGQKPQAAWDNLNAAANAAKAWLDAQLATCTKAELEAQVKTLEDALAAWYEAPVGTINTNTWYYIQFASSRASIGKNTCYATGSQLKEARLSAGYAQASDLDTFGGDNTSKACAVIKEVYSDPDYTYTYTLTDEEGEEYEETMENAYNDEMSQWRFISVHDDAYVIQNRATGNFLPVADKSNYQANVGLSPVPGEYRINALSVGGFEICTVAGSNDKGLIKTYVNQYQNTQMGFWNADGEKDLGSRWNFVPAGEIAADHQQKVLVGLDGMKVRGLTLPYDVEILTNSREAHFYNEVVGIDMEHAAVGVKEVTGTVKLGTPMLVFSSADMEMVAPAEVKMAGNKISWSVYSNVLRGTLAPNDSVNAGVALPIFDENDDYIVRYKEGAWGGLKTIKARQHVNAGSAWLDLHEASEALTSWNALTNTADADEILLLNTNRSDLKDEIVVVKGEKKNNGVIFNLSGQRVAAPAKGLYIINGKKVVVK